MFCSLINSPFLPPSLLVSLSLSLSFLHSVNQVEYVETNKIAEETKTDKFFKIFFVSRFLFLFLLHASAKVKRGRCSLGTEKNEKKRERKSEKRREKH
jgi:hypothetical protein